MDKEVTLTLPANDVGQILDGLLARFNEWQYTADQFDDDGNFIGTGDYTMQECSGKAEAQSIADTYKRIIGSIEKQVANG